MSYRIICGVIFMLLFCAGCASRSQGSVETTVSGTSTQSGSDLHVDPYGQLSVTQHQRSSPTLGPRWLSSIHEGDVLTYRVRSQEGQEQMHGIHVKRMTRVEQGVAAWMVPIDAVSDGEQEGEDMSGGYWLVGDDSGLYRLSSHGSLMDPGFIPLDDRGRVVSQGRANAEWVVPPEWKDLIREGEDTASSLDQGWSIEELDMTVDGPVRGDSCAAVSKKREDGFIRLLICANLGVVEKEQGMPDALGNEHWQLVEIRRH